MIKFNNNTINDWNYGTSNLIKVYRNNAIVFYKVSGESPTPEYQVCFAVVDDITQYQETEFEDVYDKATDKWYKLNNLDEYEQYGVYGSGRNITYYDGKLTIDDGYEYQYTRGSWVNVGEVTGSTATLPNIPFVLNYNAKNYDAATHSIPMTSGQLNDTDAVAYNNPNNIVDHHEDGYITISNSSMRIRKSGQDISLFNRQSNSTSSDLTIVCKAKSTGGENIITNRDGNYNWMYRLKTSGILRFHGTSETGQISWNTSNPDIMSVRTYYNNTTYLMYNNWTQNTSTSPVAFTYGSTNSDGGYAGALFVGYGWNNTNEQWSGDFYWVYMAQANLTDAQIQEVIDYNEEGGQSEYPIYYDDKSDPLNDLTFNTMEDAQAYAYNNCVYDGMKATIDGDRYYFDSEDENGWVKILEYYKVEDVTPSGGSGWTISGSSTYNPDSAYYDDFDLETTSTSNVTKIAKVTIYGYDHFTYYLRSYHGYSGAHGYVMSTNVDEIQAPPASMSYDSSSAITTTYYWNKSPKSAVNLSNYRRVTYNNLDKTVEHTFYVYFYGRTYSSYVGNATILIPKEQTNENWEQVTFSSSTNVSGTTKSLYIDGNYSNSGGTQYFYNRWMIGLPSGSHSSYTNYSSYDYCPNKTSSTFTSVAGEQRQVNFTYDNTSNKSLSFRLTDGSNVLTPSDTVYYNMTLYNSCGVSSSSSNVTFPSSKSVKVVGSFSFSNSSNRHYIYGYQPPTLGTRYYVDNYQSTFDIVYTKLSEEAVTITYTTYDPNDVETPAFNTDITYPYNGGTTSSTTLTSYGVPYTYPYTVKQTNDKFSADSQSYTANQAARTISFTLYPNNREFATVADLEVYQYAWEGMTAYVGSDKYVYQNGEWVYKPSRLPVGYTEVEYIRQNSNYNAYINTGVILFDNTSNTYTVTTKLTSEFHSNLGCATIISAEVPVSPYNGMGYRYKCSSTVDELEFFGGNSNYSSSSVDNGDGTRTITFQSTGNTSWASNAPLSLLCSFSDTSFTTPFRYSDATIYSSTIVKNGITVRDFVPAKRDSDSVYGLYDLINDVFYTSPNGNNFSGGEPV